MSINFRVIDTLLPIELVQCIQSSPSDSMSSSHREKCMVSVAMMVVKLIGETALSIKKHQIKDLDANPGDRGCQLQAVLLKKLVTTPIIMAELKQLEETSKALLSIVIQRNTLNGNLKPCHDSTEVFFEKHISSLSVSQELLYLLLCKLLKVTKVKDYVEANGIIVTRLDFTALAKLSKNIHIIDQGTKNFREQIVSEASSWLSEKSLFMIQEEGKKRDLPPLFTRMVLEIRQNKPAPPQIKKSFGLYKPKSFGCQFFGMKMVLTLLSEQEALIAIKTVVVKGKPQMLFFKPSRSGDEFCPLEITHVPKEELIVVFEGVIQPEITLEEFSRQVTRIGFTRLILACTSQVDPFEHGSNLGDVADLEARVEIEAHKRFADENNLPTLFLLDHVFCNSLQEELKTC